MNLISIAWLAGAIVLLLLGHYFRILRWERFIDPYEKPPVGALFRSLSLGYALNLILPVRGGDILRTVYIGTKLENGMGFALGTVIYDRFLDIIAVALIFIILQVSGMADSTIIGSALLYEVAVILIGAILVVCRLFSRQVKKMAATICSIFNDTIRLEGMKFFWSLINTFRDFRKINLLQVVGYTVAMWAAYLASYGLFAVSVSGTGVGIFDVIITLFSRSSLGVSALTSAKELGGSIWYSLAYTIIPILALWLVTLLPEVFRHALGMRTALIREDGDEDYLNILPQVDERDQMRFLDDYFNSSNREYIKKFIELNRNVSILRDYSAGSNATTMLCMDRDETFYRKYAFGDDGEKLRQQLEWIEAHDGDLPLCQVLRSDCGEGYCSYDMTYDSGAYGMFRYMHSKPVERTWAVLRSVLDCLRENLYTRNERTADDACLEKYLDEKVDRNLERMRASRVLSDISEKPYLIINGKRYKNLSLLEGLFDHAYLRKVFANDRYSDIHGDLTIENIICLDYGVKPEESYYIIDPNTGNIHDSPFLDFGKLLQSLHGGYEFLMMTKSMKVEGGRIDFLYTRSAAYDEMLKRLVGYLRENFGEMGLRSIFHHELVHWLRLMPYKLENDRKRAPMFYAGLVMVANDIAKGIS